MLDVLEGLEGLAGMLDEDQCDCWFNKTEVKNSGGWEKTDDSMAGGSSVHDRDPIRCLKSCREQFLATVLPGYNNETDTETFKSVCGKLTAKGPNLDLWPLYWCDSTLCGVWIDPAVKSGQDRESLSRFRGCNHNTPLTVYSQCRPDYQPVPKVDTSLLSLLLASC